MRLRRWLLLVCVGLQVVVATPGHAETSRTLTAPYATGFRCENLQAWSFVTLANVGACQEDQNIKDKGLISAGREHMSRLVGGVSMYAQVPVDYQDFVGMDRATPLATSFNISATAMVSSIRKSGSFHTAVCLLLITESSPVDSNPHVWGWDGSGVIPSGLIPSGLIPRDPAAGPRGQGVAQDCLSSDQPERPLSVTFVGTTEKPTSLGMTVRAVTYDNPFPYGWFEQAFDAAVYQVNSITYTSR